MVSHLSYKKTYFKLVIVDISILIGIKQFKSLLDLMTLLVGNLLPHI